MPYKDLKGLASKASQKRRHQRWYAKRGKTVRQAWEAENSEGRRVYQARWYVRNREARKNQALQRIYGISLERAKELLLLQGSKCLLCERKLNLSSKNTVVDHDHHTNRVRGLLCRKCNMMVGIEENTPGIFQRTLEYLERSRRLYAVCQ